MIILQITLQTVCFQITNIQLLELNWYIDSGATSQTSSLCLLQYLAETAIVNVPDSSIFGPVQLLIAVACNNKYNVYNTLPYSILPFFIGLLAYGSFGH